MGDNISTDKNSTPTNLYGNLPAKAGDSATKVKQFFNQYYSEPFEFSSNEVDATVAFFSKRGFDEVSANSVATIVPSLAMAPVAPGVAAMVPVPLPKSTTRRRPAASIER